MNTNDQMRWYVDQAYTLAEQHVELLARKIMRKHPNVTAFVMAMGDASFEVNGKSLGLNERAYFKELNDFIDEWDELLHITGNPMWIEGPDAPIIRQW